MGGGCGVDLVGRGVVEGMIVENEVKVGSAGCSRLCLVPFGTGTAGHCRSAEEEKMRRGRCRCSD